VKLPERNVLIEATCAPKPTEMRIAKPLAMGDIFAFGDLALFPFRHRSAKLKRSPSFEAFDHVREKLLRMDLVVIVLGPLMDDLI